MFETIALIASLNDVAMVGEAVEQGGCHFGITEYGRPFGEGEVRCDNDWRALVELTDQMEQELTSQLCEW